MFCRANIDGLSMIVHRIESYYENEMKEKRRKHLDLMRRECMSHITLDLKFSILCVHKNGSKKDKKAIERGS
jgi:hypothetical protein